MGILAIFLAVASIVVFLFYRAKAAKHDDNIAYLDANNFEIAQAKLQAQASLDRFRSLKEQNPERFASVKVALPTGQEDEFEHIWVEGLVPGSPNIPWTGRLANDPFDLPGLKLGSEVSFSESDIEDWIVETGENSIEGGFSRSIMNR